MTDMSVSGGPLATPAKRPQKMAMQGAVNSVLRGMLRTPLISRGIGKRLVTLYIVGRKSGRQYTIPVAYTSHDGALLIGTPFGWGRNLRTGEPIDIRYKGRRRLAEVEVMTDEAAVTEAYAIMCRDNKAFAGFNKIGVDAAGNPDPADLRAAWAGGSRAFRLTPR